MIVVTDENFDSEVFASDLPVVVDFYADWCSPRRALTPVFEAYAAKYLGRVKFVKVNADNSSATLDRFGVRGIPTVILFEKDNKKAVGVGFPNPKLEELLSSLDTRYPVK